MTGYGPGAMRPYLSHEHPIRLAHRGSRVLWPQNTVAAFQGAVDLGYRYIETDLHVSADGRVVVFHDDHLSDLTDGVGKVWDRDWVALAEWTPLTTSIPSMATRCGAQASVSPCSQTSWGPSPTRCGTSI